MSGKKLALFGCNMLGLEVARRLESVAHGFVMADRDPQRVEQAQHEGFAAVCMDYTDDDALRQLGIGGEIGRVFCFLPDDAENVFLTISARSLDASLQIIALTQSTEAAGKLLAAGADKVIDPYEISGARIFEILERPEVVEVLENTVFGRQDLNIAELTVPAGAWTDQCPLSALRHAIKQNVILLGVVDRERGSELIYSMRGVDHKLDAGDVLVVLGSRRQIESLRELIGRVAVPDGAGI